MSTPTISITCPACGATAETVIRPGLVQVAPLFHEGDCAWLAKGAGPAPTVRILP